MADKAPATATATPAASLTKVPRPMIQRKCACGGTVGPSGMCAECEKKQKEKGKIQRKGAGSVASIPSSVGSVLGGVGQPLDAGTRSSMESRFGTSLGAVRVHTDSRAAESARSLNAQAYTVGNNIVFDHGQYSPTSAGGSRLLAHELAHTIQQGGLQTKSYSDLSVSPSNSPLEIEADRAAEAVTSGFAAPALSKVNTPVVSRATPNTTSTTVTPTPTPPAVVPTTPTPSPTPATPTASTSSGPCTLTNVPAGADCAALVAAGVKAIIGNSAANRIFVLDDFPLNQNKGEVAVKLYEQLAQAGQLIAVMNTSGTGGSTALKQGRDDSDMLRKAWLQKYSWTSVTGPSNWQKLSGGPLISPFKPVRFDKVTCHMDHIQELQVGGAGNPSNIQVLDPDPNIESGRDINSFLKQKATDIVSALGSPTPPTISLQFKSIQKVGAAPQLTLSTGQLSCLGVEMALLTGKNPTAGTGTAVTANRTQVLLYAGVQSASAYLNKGNPVTDLTNTTVLENRGVMLLVPGFILTKYTRAATSSGTDKINAEIDPNKLGNRTSQTRIPVTISSQTPFQFDSVAGSPSLAAPVTVSGATPPAPASGPAPAAPTGTVTPGQAGVEAGSAAETRMIKAKKSPSKVAFHYPYLSEGSLNVTPDEEGVLTGTGTLKPSIPLLKGKTLDLTLAPDKLSAVLKSGMVGTKLFGIGTITDASLTADLLPTLGASGNLSIAFGSTAKPIATTSLTLSADPTNGFMATGKLIVNIPQIDQAEGDVTYKNGAWFGQITISTSQIRIPMVKSSTLVVSFSEKGVQVAGGVVMDVKGNPVNLNANLVNGTWVFTGGATLTFSPLRPVHLSFRYANEKLTAEGDTTFGFKGLEGKVHVKYDDGVVTGDGTLNMNKGRMTGTINAHYTRNGNITADGKISYKITDNLVASVGIEVDEKQNVRLTGELTFPKPIQLFSRIGNNINLFSIRTDIPIAGISVGPVSIGLVFRIEGGLGFDYGVGPGQIRNLHLSAAFNPFDDDPKFDLKGGGQLYIPAGAGVSASIRGALAVSAGIASVSGGITATARAGLDAALTADLDIEYKEGRFTLDSTVALIGKPVLDFGLEANIEAEAGALGVSYKYHKGYQLASFTLPSDMEMGAKFPIHYASNEAFKFPSLSDIQVIKPNIDVKGLMNSMLTKVGAL
ncbi:MAG: DUF4157 domain-containing protein [Armatimonadetes bacterium]|nr:DUF4157 domain-containing protein [Armatimonadota bacterium]